MQFNWFTFVLQMVSFAILVWVLTRILYGPIRRAVQRRQAETRAILDAAAEAQRETAAPAEAAYQAREADWTRSQVARRAELEARSAPADAAHWPRRRGAARRA